MSHLRAQSDQIAQHVVIFTCLSAVWLSTSCDATAGRAFEPSTGSPVSRFASHEIVIKFKDGVSQERIAFIVKTNQIEVIAEIQRGYLYHVRIIDKRSVASVITQLTSHQEIEYAEPNYRYETQK
jgi:hypothetical protein